MRILIISDAWHPQINSLVRTLNDTIHQLRDFGHEVHVISPNHFRTLPCPTYPEVRLAVLPYKQLAGMIDKFSPETLHIATEGPLGWAARRWCLKNNKPFTSAYHTQLPEYIKARIHLPLSWSYALMRRFHRPAKSVLVSTPSMQNMLRERGFSNTAQWSRGVDFKRFFPASRDAVDHLCTPETIHQPKFCYIGRVAKEKNLEAFLSLDLPGTKWVAGDGPERHALELKYPDVTFLGTLPQDELPPLYRAADVFVSPSKTDTFDLAILEAMACGTPVAALPVIGPIDIITDEKVGVLDDNLGEACTKAIKLRRSNVYAFAQKHSWKNATHQFERWLVPFNTK